MDEKDRSRLPQRRAFQNRHLFLLWRSGSLPTLKPEKPLFWMPHDGCDLVLALQCFSQERRADIADGPIKAIFMKCLFGAGLLIHVECVCCIRNDHIRTGRLQLPNTPPVVSTLRNSSFMLSWMSHQMDIASFGGWGCDPW